MSDNLTEKLGQFCDDAKLPYNFDVGLINGKEKIIRWGSDMGIQPDEKDVIKIKPKKQHIGLMIPVVDLSSVADMKFRDGNLIFDSSSLSLKTYYNKIWY